MIFRKQANSFMNHIKQKDAMDCGPACLAMVVKHYGRNPYLEQIQSGYDGNKCSLEFWRQTYDKSSGRRHTH